ncbi:UvrD-helicase domain-containing protein [Cupriavidus sp. DL-D2]|uniref:UvrD-helicase domain-containing protein n=1 Tax=Cupriavidus sp. DL-D2 TaxID=3144974 RepID=UPI0032125568
MTKILADNEARRVAIAAHDRSLLVEAGAGSGKTAVMAGRIVMLLAKGVAPKRIAAVTFTELAASELLIRVREFVAALLANPAQPPAEMVAALPNGLDWAQQANLAAANHVIDEMNCSTIHGFCQRLIKPYPVEADIDPGATLMDRDQGDLSFQEIADDWLRDALSPDDSLLAELALRDPDQTIALVHKVLRLLRHNRHATASRPKPLAATGALFLQASESLAAFLRECGDAAEAETVEISACFGGMAAALAPLLDRDGPAALAALLFTRADEALLTSSGSFAAFRKKGKWQAAAKLAGLSKPDAERLCDQAAAYYAACCVTWDDFSQQMASHVLAEMVALLGPVTERFRAYKRDAGLLDFDDLIHAARDLLRDHEPVRQALAARYAHVLVDEFQDTDPLQSEIFWRLCGDPPAGADLSDWSCYRIREGALFLVGDPKQAIYRFRGADVAAYVQARDAFAAQDASSILTISTNFRSQAPILHYVNERFAALLSTEIGQPGFTALHPFHAAVSDSPCVVALDVVPAGAGSDQLRDAEAEAVADLCARLIGSHMLVDRKSGSPRACRPGDIALLAPTGSELWRYEEALERRGVPVATQAGKGLYRRQEIQDLIALTRVLADPADTLALGALLRGPLVGLSEETLLDIVAALPLPDDAPEAIPRLSLGSDAQHIVDPHARDILQKLQSLRRRANTTTPHDLLAQAVDVMRVRPLLMQRHRGQAERALANVDLYLNMASAYAVRGLRALAIAMTEAWDDESRAPEGRPDAQEEAVALYTMHAAKGLEWPIVVPINTMTQTRAAESTLVDRQSGCVYCPVFGLSPVGLDKARRAEQEEVGRERIRLWYVAATRARDLLVLPRLAADMRDNMWMALPRFPLRELPGLDVAELPEAPGIAPVEAGNRQTRALFEEEATRIVQSHRKLTWLAPSRDEGVGSPLLAPAEPAAVTTNLDEGAAEASSARVQGGRERGLLIHKLLEEVLNGEVADDPDSLLARAGVLIGMLGLVSNDDPARGVSAAEIAGCVGRTLVLPEIAEIRPVLVPEYALLSATATEAGEAATVGIADAVGFSSDGKPQVVVDWKSDVNPTPETIDHYRAQVGQYLTMTGASRGLIVMATSGRVVEVRIK